MFRELQTLACGSKYVLPGRGAIDKPQGEGSLNAVLDRISFDLTPFVIHDMRRTGSTLLNSNGFAHNVVEVALGHAIPGVRGVYDTSEYVAERKKMLQWWSDYVDNLVNGSNVVVGNFGA